MRNLIYFICPFSANQEWKRNLDELRPYMAYFTGLRLCTIATGDGLEEPQTVEDYLTGIGFEYAYVENDPSKGEAVSFVESLERVYSRSNIEKTFYAHGRGVSPTKRKEELDSIRRWRRLSYTYCLSDILRVDAVLDRFACCGCFKKYGSHHLPNGAAWHFSGTFFWFNHKDIFIDQNWRTLSDDRYAVEGYLARFISAEQAYCLFADNPMPSNLYRYRSEDWIRLYNLPDSFASSSRQDTVGATETADRSDIIAALRESSSLEEIDLVLRREGIKISEITDWLTKDRAEWINNELWQQYVSGSRGHRVL